MNITEKVENEVSIFAPDGRIDSEGALDLEMALQVAYEEGTSRIILDLSEVTYINSAGLRILADFLCRMQERGGDLLLVRLSPRIQRVLQIIGFDNFFRIFDSLDQALRAF
jgi:anti-anti-sigma factor